MNNPSNPMKFFSGFMAALVILIALPIITSLAGTAKIDTWVYRLKQEGYIAYALTGDTDFLIGVLDADENRVNPAEEDGNLAGIKTNTDTLDVALSTRLKPSDLNLDGDKDIQTDVKSSALPTGAATETSLAGVKTNTDTLDINLSRAALAANVAQHMVQTNYGYRYGFVDAGTPIPVSTTNTFLDISGFGKLTFVSADIDDTGKIYTYIYLDGEDVPGVLSQAAYLGYRKGSDSKLGLQAGWVDVIHWETAKYGIDYHVGKLGSFGTSAKVQIRNADAENTHKAHIRANYFVSASKEIAIDNPLDTNVASVRTQVADELGMSHEAVTTVYSVNWDEDLQTNVPKLEVYIHPEIDNTQTAKIENLMANKSPTRTVTTIDHHKAVSPTTKFIAVK
jgi:hypothetical protein